MQPEQTEKVFVSGMYLDRVHENAPDFVLTNQTIHIEHFIAWLQENKHLASERGYIKVVGKESRNKDDKGFNKRYFEVDTYKKPEETTPVTNTPTQDTAQPPVAPVAAPVAQQVPAGEQPVAPEDLPW